MDSIALDQEIGLKHEGIVIPSKEGLFPHMKTKMAEHFYRERGFEILEGEDFEHNLIRLFAKSEQWRKADRYSKVKMGKNPDVIKEAYCRAALSLFPKHDVERLLYACRECSYLGGPGFPEFIAYKGDEMLFVYVGSSDELLASQKIFMALVTLFGIHADFTLFDVADKPIPPRLAFACADVIRPALGNEKTKERLAILAEEMEKAKKDGKNAILYWNNERAKLPFPLFRKWAEAGEMGKEDVENNMREISYYGLAMMQLFEEMKAFALSSAEFKALGDKQDEQSLRQKTALFMEKFQVNEHTAKDFMTYLLFG